MEASAEYLYSQAQTGEKMKKWVKRFWRDLGFYVDLPLRQFFNHVRNLTYYEDKNAEYIVRPKYFIDKGPADCKKKAILMASWAEAHGIPWRFVAVSEYENRPIHHVYTQFLFDKKWFNVDPTYAHFELFAPKKIYEGKLL